MSESYIPTSDALAKDWMVNFAARITANPALYLLSAADAANLQSVVDDYVAAYATAVEPVTRTPVTIAAKDTARNVAEQLCRQFAILIKFNAGISDEDKIAAGVRPPNPNRDPVNVPASSPLLNVLGATPGSHTVRYSDTSTPDSSAKPFGAASLELWVAVEDEAVTDEGLAEFKGSHTRNPIGVGYTEDDDGKVATYFGRWVSRKGETGPWSLAVSMRIAA